MLKEKIISKEAKVGIIGLGYVGLPLAIEAAHAGFQVTGFDVNPVRVKEINGGNSYIPDVSPEIIKGVRTSDRFQATTDFDLLKNIDVIVICVPTPLSEKKEPDVSYIEAAINEISQRLKENQLVILESTTYPGTTEELVLPALERNGLKVGNDFFLAFSPERVDPGNKNYSIKNTPKVVGGVTKECTELVCLFYNQFVDTVVPVSCPKVAEMTKLLENIFRCVNIALVNELSMLGERMGINIWEVIKAASTKPFGFMPFYPGPGWGGHCVPVDPFYLSWKAQEYDFCTEFIELAGKINQNMPSYVVERTTEALNCSGKSLKGSKVLLLGVAYKKDIDDTRESPALKIIEILEEKGALISYHDPYVNLLKVGKKEYKSAPLFETVEKSNCVIIVADHSNIDYRRVLEKASLVVDTRNTLDGIENGKIFRL